jgi:hypothetical protein
MTDGRSKLRNSRRSAADLPGKFLSSLPGETSAERAKRSLNVCKALLALVRLVAEMVRPVGPASSGPAMSENTIIARWPKACRRARVPVIDLPPELMRIPRRNGLFT